MVANFSRNSNLSLIKNDLPPQNIETEEAIIGGLLLDRDSIKRVKKILEPEHFYVSRLGFIYQCCLDYFEKEGQMDGFLFISYLRDNGLLDQAGGDDYLLGLCDCIVSTVNIERYAQLIRDKWIARQIIDLGNTAIKLGSQQSILRTNVDTLEEIQLQIDTLKALGTGKTDKQVGAHNLVNKLLEIEAIADPVFREYSRIMLSKEVKLSTKQLDTILNKYYLSRFQGKAMTLPEFREKYKDSAYEWLLHGFLPKSTVNLLYAQGGVGKTRLCYDWLFCLLNGINWGEEASVTAKSRKCLLLQTDEPSPDTLQALEGRGFDDKLDLLIRDQWNFEHIPSLRQEIIEKGIEFVVIDSLTTNSYGTPYSEIDQEYARPLLQLRDIAAELGTTFVVIHHANAEGNRARGTTAIHNAVSQVFALELPSEGSEADTPKRRLKIKKSRLRAPAEYELEFHLDHDSGTWSWINHGIPQKEPSLEAGDEHLAARVTKEIEDRTIKGLILDLFRKNRGIKFVVQDTAHILGKAYRSVARALGQLACHGLISKERSMEKGRPFKFWLSWSGEQMNPDQEDHDQTHDQGLKPLPKASLVMVDIVDTQKTEVDHPPNLKTFEKIDDQEDHHDHQGSIQGFQEMTTHDQQVTSDQEVTTHDQQFQIGDCVQVETSKGKEKGLVISIEPDGIPSVQILGKNKRITKPFALKYISLIKKNNAKG